MWQTRIGHGSPLGGIEWGMAVHDGLVFAPLSDINQDDPQNAGGMFALDVKTGKVVWHTPSPKLTCLAQRGCNAALIALPTVIAGRRVCWFDGWPSAGLCRKNRRSHLGLRYGTQFDTVDNVPAHGGSFGGSWTHHCRRNDVCEFRLHSRSCRAM